MITHLKHIVFGLSVLLIAACGRQEPNTVSGMPAPSETQPLNYQALVIGISDYSGTGWPELGTAKEDAVAMGEVLREQYGFKVMELTDRQATRGNILRTLDQLMNLNDNDALLIYFAGHGYYDRQMDEGYWIPYGAQRQRLGLPAKEDWLWNSSINRVISALPARHVLLVADTCYGGSLFRGAEEPVKTGTWYQRAIQVPSRYVITSGDLEPVLDSGIRHSVFAQELLNYLLYTENDVFSASDLAISIRSKVSELTGQLVRMGPVLSSANAGGEFVFARRSASTLSWPANTETEQGELTTTNGSMRGSLEVLVDRMNDDSRKTTESFVRPRVLACMGPDGEDSKEAAIVQRRLFEALDTLGGCILVERDDIDALFQEMELGSSDRADIRMATEIGRLLPASLMLLGDILPVGDMQEVHLRIVDTETSRVLSSASASYGSIEEMDRACQTLAKQVMETMNTARPLTFSARYTDKGTLLANWGRFHGARIGDVFEIITRVAIGTVSQKDIPIGTATILLLNEESAEFHPVWYDNHTDRTTTNMWLKAVL